MSAHELCPDCGEPQEFDPPEHVCRSHYCAAKLEAKVARLHDAVVEEQRLCALKLKSVHEEVARLREELAKSHEDYKIQVNAIVALQDKLAAAREALEEAARSLEAAAGAGRPESLMPDLETLRPWAKARARLVRAALAGEADGVEKERRACETCNSLEDGGHYCLLHGRPVRDANIRSCSE